MHAKASTSSRRSIVRRLVVLPAVAVGLSLAFAGAASAQTGFQASVTAHVPKPKPCPNGAFFCGDAITNYGDATWTFTLISVTSPPPGAECGSYEATVTFALSDGSTLTLDENGTVCGPGKSLFSSRSNNSYGNPFYLAGTLTVESATGQFNLISGPGSDSVHAAGAESSGTYATVS
jgi:hypothetical protein